MKTNPSFAKSLGIGLAALLLAASLFAQAPTGNLVGKVLADGNPMPGVTVTATSPSLLGTRVVVTGNNGSFKLAFMPPGEYSLTYELEGFATSVQTVIVSAAQDKVLDAVSLKVADVVEEIVITSNLETISEGNSGETTYSIDEIEDLPVNRNIRAATLLSPGVSASGPKAGTTRNAGLAISGAMSFESLFLVNGVVVNENVRGQSLDLFIEDAIQEFTVATSGVSAEYGRFSGGVVNVLTKSGGNEFSGSLRRSYTQADWTKEVDEKYGFTEVLSDVLNETDELTLGGPLWRDHIWFFGAYRDIGENVATVQTASPTNIPFDRVTTQERFEAKLTFAPHPSHSLVANYLEIKATQTNSTFGNVLDLASRSDRSDPQDLKAGHYTGILTSSFFVEAQYSERFFLVADGSGSPFRDVIGGTVLVDRARNRRYHTGTFCGACGGDERDNENWLAKGSYFLSTEGGGTHDFVGGVDEFTDIRIANNHQSGSDFDFRTTQSATIPAGTTDIFPRVRANDWLFWWPILENSKGTDFATQSLYVNDSWQVNEKMSLNLGLRYDKNDGRDASGNLVAKDDRISPRLGLAYDLKGDGDWVLNAGVGRYVAAIANTQADSGAAGGQPALFAMFYGGPSFNQVGQPQTNQDDVLRGIFNWYTTNGGCLQPEGCNFGNLPGLFYVSVPGVSAVIEDSLSSPFVDEITVGVVKRLGSKGLVRADLVFREFGDFYAQEVTQRTGQVGDEFGNVFDKAVFYNEDNLLERTYEGLHVNARYRATDKLTFSGNYTYSKNEGNVDGETAGSGPTSAGPLTYPEYHEARWNTPVGYIGTDQRHKVNFWTIYDVFNTDHHSLTASGLVSHFSGTPYGAPTTALDTSPFVNNPGYAFPSTAETYYFTARDAFETDDVTTLDLALNYAFKWNLWNRTMEVFIQPELLNVFNDQGVILANSTVVLGDEFNPFTETPVEGTHWEKGPLFGNPNSPNDINTPRTYRVSVGFRF